MGRDYHGSRTGRNAKNFNPLSPHGERPATAQPVKRAARFQSTLPAWGETSEFVGVETLLRFQSTLPAWGETISRDIPKNRTDISIHSPRMGRDVHPAWPGAWHYQFQSTLPAWGETRSSRGATGWYKFQSTLPAWGETLERVGASIPGVISIHSPRMGRDDRRRSPGVATSISIHSPRMGRDLPGRRTRADSPYFNPLSPHGERHNAIQQAAGANKFQSTLPAWGETAEYRAQRQK